MRYLRRQVLNRRSPSDSRLAVDIDNAVIMDTPKNLLLPKGVTDDRPVSPKLGMIRYNTTTNDVEVYQGLTEGSGAWRSLRYKESIGITQQTLGIGDDVETIFGPLNPAPPDSDPTLTVQTNTAWTGNNIIVLVENVVQIFTTNYTVLHLGPENPQGRDPGSYVAFDSPVPTGKYVTVLHGFDK